MNSSTKKELDKLFSQARNLIVSEVRDELGIDLAESTIVDDILEDLLDDVRNVVDAELSDLESSGNEKDVDMQKLQDEIYDLQKLVEELEDTIETWKD